MDKLSKAFKDGNYESKSCFLTELIEHGFTANQNLEQRRNELDTENVKIGERLSALESQWSEFAKSVYAELKAFHKECDITHRAIGAVYYILQSIYFDESITSDELDSGFYDILPARFRSCG